MVQAFQEENLNQHSESIINIRIESVPVTQATI